MVSIFLLIFFAEPSFFPDDDNETIVVLERVHLGIPHQQHL